MILKELATKGKVLEGLVVTKEELDYVIEKCPYVSISDESKEVIKDIKNDEVAGAIFGDVNNVFADVGTEGDISTVDNPSCEFVSCKELDNLR